MSNQIWNEQKNEQNISNKLPKNEQNMSNQI